MKRIGVLLLLVVEGALLTSSGCGPRSTPTGFPDAGPLDTGIVMPDASSSSSSSGGGSSGGSSDGGPPLFGDGATGGNEDATPGDAGCATATSSVTRQPVYMLFIEDGSGSMHENNKWNAVVPALGAIFDDMQSKADPGVAAGLIVFSDSQDQTFGMGPYPEQGLDVPVALVDTNHNSALHNRLSGQPQLTTPTHAALTGGYSELESFMPAAPLPSGGQKVVILITDGVPTDACAQQMGNTNYASNVCVQLAAMKLTEAAPQGPILTYVIGVGPYPSTDPMSFDPSFLGNLAKSGGTGPMGCNPSENAAGATDFCYFQVDPTQTSSVSQLQQAFEDAINKIRGQVVSCTFPLQLTGGGHIDPMKVNVEIGGMQIGQDPKDGWTYDNPMNPTEIILHGKACDNLKGNPTTTVQVILGCQTVVTPPPKFQ
jgi:hypothetical protein